MNTLQRLLTLIVIPALLLAEAAVTVRTTQIIMSLETRIRTLEQRPPQTKLLKIVVAPSPSGPARILSLGQQAAQICRDLSGGPYRLEELVTNPTGPTHPYITCEDETKHDVYIDITPEMENR